MGHVGLVHRYTHNCMWMKMKQKLYAVTMETATVVVASNIKDKTMCLLSTKLAKRLQQKKI